VTSFGRYRAGIIPVFQKKDFALLGESRMTLSFGISIRLAEVFRVSVTQESKLDFNPGKAANY
jgi:hypothetical protein